MLGALVAVAAAPTLARAERPTPCTESIPAEVEGARRLAVRVREAGNRRPIERAAVHLLPAPSDVERPGPLRGTPEMIEGSWHRQGRAVGDGWWCFDDVPVAGLVRLVAIVPGLGRYDAHVEVEDAAEHLIRVFVRADEDAAYRTVVKPDASEIEATPGAQILDAEEIRTLPGSWGDPLRAIQNLPGVARSPGRLGLLVLRGASPVQSRVFLGGHAVPRAFHMFALSSVFPTDILDSLRFEPGNFDVAWGGATGGVVVIEPRAGRRDGFHGYAELDLAAAGALVEGPLGKGSFIVAAQRGYVDAVLRLAERAGGETTTGLGNAAFPAYYDYQGTFDHPIGDHGSASVRVFGAGDRLRSHSGGAGAGNQFEFRSDFHRLDLVLRWERGPTSVRWIPSVRFELARFSDTVPGIMTRRAERADWIGAHRLELRHRVSRRFALRVGTDLELGRFRGEQWSSLMESGGAEVSHGLEGAIGVYADARLDVGRWSLVPGVRATSFLALDQVAFSVDPRVTARVQLSRRWSLKAGLGRYSQVRPIQLTESYNLTDTGAQLDDGAVYLPDVFMQFDPEVALTPTSQTLTAISAWHASLGAALELARGVSVELTGFWREQDNGTPLEFQGGVVPYRSTTRTYGLEFLARKRITRNFYGWLAYTLLWSQASFVEQAPGLDLRGSPSAFDQRHNLNLVASYRLPHRWRLSGGFRLVSGYPYTPIVGSIALEQGRYIPIAGRRNAARLPWFHQLDVRVDKSWLLKRAEVFAYLDLQNVYNRINAEAAVYSADVREQVDIVGVPIFPSFGVRVEY